MMERQSVCGDSVYENGIMEDVKVKKDIDNKEVTFEKTIDEKEKNTFIMEEKKNAKKKKIAIILGSIAILVGIVVYFNSDMYMYNQAVKLYEKKDYYNAALKFDEIRGYKNSDELWTDCRIAYGDELYDAGEYETALSNFSQIGNVDTERRKKAYEGSRKCAYQIASEIMKEGNYEEALEWLQEYDWCNDEIAQECMYNIGKEYYENEDYDKALEYLQNIDYEDSKQLVDSLVNNPMSLEKFIERYNNIIDSLSGDVEYLSAYKLDADNMSNNKIEFDGGASTIYFKFNSISEKDCKYEIDSVEFYMKGWIMTSSDLLAAIQFALFGAYSPDTTAEDIPMIINQLYNNEENFMGVSRCAITVNGVEYIASKTKMEIKSVARNAE